MKNLDVARKILDMISFGGENSVIELFKKLDLQWPELSNDECEQLSSTTVFSKQQCVGLFIDYPAEEKKLHGM